MSHHLTTNPIRAGTHQDESIYFFDSPPCGQFPRLENHSKKQETRRPLVSAKLPTLRTLLRTCAPPTTSLLIAAEAPQPLVCAIRAWSRPTGRQASRTPPARASTLYRPEALVLPRGPAPALGAGSPAMPARRRKLQKVALFDAVQRRAGLLDFKQPLQPPRRGYPACMIGDRSTPSIALR